MILDQIFISNQKKAKEEKSKKVEKTSSESTLRSVVKSISWRVVGTIDTVVISWLITGEVALAISIGTVELVTKMALYFFHERAWNNIKWGKNE
ncbi:DUF2061 domain-containing protein [Lutibacter sp. TH_r2]|uniref:DUF2061 domain-containing protein n=1 Tax=Lutibacter sp. TH_r2 TaxID=3082083 RepID=UPI0029530145|nr:DUF2061 domain-containing protein [Lutibacter sp. TH_r2]MDV7187831.1 DUF2061 domain-containing protein [Lutibacter sp. TH_r2]